MFLNSFKTVKKSMTTWTNLSWLSQAMGQNVTAICELTLTQLLLNFAIRQNQTNNLLIKNNTKILYRCQVKIAPYFLSS